MKGNIGAINKRVIDNMNLDKSKITLQLAQEFDIDNVIADKDDNKVELSDSLSFKISQQDYEKMSNSSLGRTRQNKTAMNAKATKDIGVGLISSDSDFDEAV